tara:strand:- start:741 stop:1124 length:384 start_codon:yes stop_codon:yes gene_type:complete
MVFIANFYKKYKTYINICIALVIGFLIAYSFNFKSNRRGFRLQELVLLMKGNCYHIHHFMWIAAIIISMIIARYLSKTTFYLLVAFFIGLSSEDLLFKDWNVIKNNCHKSKLIKFMKQTTDVNSKYN